MGEGKWEKRRERMRKGREGEIGSESRDWGET